MPDIHSISYGFAAWVELKAIVAAPLRSTTPLLGKAHGLNPGQRNWHLNCAKHRGNSFVLIGVGSNRQYLLDGKLHDEINDLTIEQIGAASIATTWPLIARTLGSQQA